MIVLQVFVSPGPLWDIWVILETKFEAFKQVNNRNGETNYLYETVDYLTITAVRLVTSAGLMNC